MIGLFILVGTAAGAGFLTDLLFFAMGDPQEGVVARRRIFSRLGKYLLDKYEAEDAKETDRVNWMKLWVCPRCLNTWLSVASIIVCLILLQSGWRAWCAIPVLAGLSSFTLSLAHASRASE